MNFDVKTSKMAHCSMWGDGKEGKHTGKRDRMKYTRNYTRRKQERRKKRKKKARLVVLGVGRRDKI